MLTGMAAVAPPPPDGPSTGRLAYWFPLLLFGGLAALSLPLSVLGSPHLSNGRVLTAVVYPTVMEAMYLGGGDSTGPFPFPLGWYWVGVLVAGLLLTAAWYRWRDGRTGARTPLRGYLVTGLALTAVTAALPLLGWGVPIEMDGPGLRAWIWVNALWRLGTAALLAIAVGLAILAWAGRSWMLMVITISYTAVVVLTGWLALQQAFIPAFWPFGDPLALLPAAVLLLAGLGTLLAAGLRIIRASRQRRSRR
jgi:hypothetical protein